MGDTMKSGSPPETKVKARIHAILKGKVIDLGHPQASNEADVKRPAFSSLLGQDPKGPKELVKNRKGFKNG